MTKTKVLSVVANPNDRSDGPNFGLVRAIEGAISAFLNENGGTEESYELAGATIDAHAGSAQDPSAVFGRTLVVLHYEPGEEHSAKSKKK